jgi:signal transduction histidine kinase
MTINTPHGDAAEGGERERYLSVVAHEIRTPLTTIVALADLMERKSGDDVSPKQMEYLRMMRLNGHRLLALVDDLLDLHKVQTGVLKIQTSEHEATALILDTVDTIRPTFEERKQFLDLELDLLESTILVDRGRVMQALLNILTNASKYSPRESSVHVRASLVNDDLYVTVRDEGDGFDLDTRDQIFEPYYRLETHVDMGIVGSGLGLALTKSLIEAHGGAIDVLSKPDMGTGGRNLPPRRES